jgi:hypothetical protein
VRSSVVARATKAVRAKTHALAPFWRQRCYTAAVPSVQIKDVPAEVHSVLRQRAAAAGKSLQEYLLARLVAEASRPTIEEVLARAGESAGGSTSLKDAARLIRADRDAA